MKFKKIQLRQSIAWVHRWVSLILGLFLIVVTLSGTALVFRPEIDRALYPNLYKSTPGTPSWEKIGEAAMKAYPGHTISYITHPSDADIAYEVILTGDSDLSVYVDPGTNKVLGAHDPANTLMGWFETLHLELFLGETGTFVEGILGLFLLFLLITGVYLWWPGIKKWILGWTVRWNRGWYIRHYDLHKVIGILTFPLLLLITLTGVAFCLYTQAETIWDTLTGTQAISYEASVTPPKENAPIVSLDVMANAARQATSGGIPTQVVLPEEPTSSAMVWVSVDYDPYVSSGFDGQVPVYIDQYTGSVIRVDDPADTSLASQIFYNWFLALHIGSYGRTPVRILYVIVGLAPTVLGITGLCTWLIKRSLRKKQQQLRALRLEQETPVSPELEAEEAKLELELEVER